MYNISLDNSVMTSKIFYHVYVSSAAKLMSSDELVKLLEVCRVNNTAIGISGMLVHKDGNFMQVIEGPEDKVRHLLEKIMLDPRHRGIMTLIEGYTEARQFSNWSMGFYELNSAEAKLVPGYNEFLNTPLTSLEFGSDPTHCQRLLLSFRKTAKLRQS